MPPDEMKVVDPTIKDWRWFEKSKLPFDLMWASNKYWLPEILRGKKIKFECTAKQSNELIDYKMTNPDGNQVQ